MIKILLALLIGVAHAQQPQQGFNSFISGLPSATTPLAGTEQTYILQNGASRKTPVSSLSSVASSLSYNITRAQIPTTTIGANKLVVVNGYRTAGDLGFGAVYSSVGASCLTGLMYIKDAGGNCFNLVTYNSAGQSMSSPNNAVVNIGWFGCYGDGGNETISSADVLANPQWRGTYTSGQTWDYVCTQEAVYAAFAGTSTPGTISWNLSSNFPNSRFYVPPGKYDINHQVFAAMQGFSWEQAGKQTALFIWTGATTTGLPMFLFDSASYGAFSNLSVDCSGVSWAFPASVGDAPADIPCVDLDHDGSSPGGLHPQQLTFYDYYQNIGRFGMGFAALLNASGSQADTIAFINPTSLGSHSWYAFEINGNNALEWTFLNGDCQQFIRACVLNNGGQFFSYGTHFEDEESASHGTGSPAFNQITAAGADTLTLGGPSSDNPSRLSGPRSEAEVLSLAQNVNQSVVNAITTASDGWGPFTGYSGYIAGNSIFRQGNLQRAFIVVDNGGTCSQWCAVTGGYGTSVLQDSAASYTTNQWAGDTLFLRYASNGFTEHCSISANTATTVTFSGCTLDSEASYQIGGTGSGGSAPTWDNASTGYRFWERTNEGNLATLVNTNCVGVDGTAYSQVSVNDWIVVPFGDRLSAGLSGTGIWPMALFAQVTAKTASSCAGIPSLPDSLTINKNAGSTVSTVSDDTLIVYGGTPLMDGSISWINLPFSAIDGAPTVDSLKLEAGWVSRPAWNNGGTVTGYAPGQRDFAFDPLINAPPGPTNGNVWNSNIFAGTIGFYQCQLSYAATIDATNCMNSSNFVTLQPTGNATITAPTSGPGLFANRTTLAFQGDSSCPCIITFGTGFRSTGTLIVGTSTSTWYWIDFQSTEGQGSNSHGLWNEAYRSQNAIGNVTVNGTATFDGQIVPAYGTPTISSGACGASTNGSIATGGTNQAGEIVIASATATTCTATFSATLATPLACVLQPGNAQAATENTASYVSAITATGFAITGTALANTNWYYHCF